MKDARNCGSLHEEGLVMKNTILLSGLTLLSTGGLKLLTHMQTSPSIDGLFCGSGSSTIPADIIALYSGSSHCWGCPVMIAGLILTAAVLIKSNPRISTILQLPA